MKMLGGNNKLFTIHIDGPAITPSVACPPHTTLDDLRAARAAQHADQVAASKRVFGTKTPAADVVTKVEPKRHDTTSLTDKLAKDGDVRRTRKRSPKPRTNGKQS